MSQGWINLKRREEDLRRREQYERERGYDDGYAGKVAQSREAVYQAAWRRGRQARRAEGVAVVSAYRVCVTGGHPTKGHAVYEAEALVWISGGMVVARFRRGGADRMRPERNTPAAKRAEVRAQAEAWIRERDT